MKNKFLIFTAFISLFFFAACKTTGYSRYEELGDEYLVKLENIKDFFRNSKKVIKYSSSVIKNYEKALTQNPKDINLIKKLARAYSRQGSIKSVFEREYSIYGWAYGNDIKSFLEIQSTADYEKALSYYDEIIKLTTTTGRKSLDETTIWTSYLHKAYIYKRLGKKNEAIAAFNKTLELYQSDIVYEEVASLYEDIGETDSAISAYEKAFELEPTSEKFLYKIALCYETAGEFDLAKDMLRKALSINPNAEYEEKINEIDKTKRMLEKLGFKSVSEMESRTVSAGAFYAHITTALAGHSRLVLYRGQIVAVNEAYYVVEDISYRNGKYVYLLGAPGNNPVATAFYLYTDRQLDISSYRNFVNESFVMKCIGTASYMKNFREVSCYVFELIE